MNESVAVGRGSFGNEDSGSGNVAANEGGHWNLESRIRCRRVAVTVAGTECGRDRACDHG